MDATNGKIHGSPTDVFMATDPAVVLVRDATMNAEEALPGVHFQVKMPIQIRIKNVGAANRLPTGVAQQPYSMSLPAIVWRQDGDALEDMLAAAASTDLRAVLASFETPEPTPLGARVRSRRAPNPIERCLATCRQTMLVMETEGLDPVQVEKITAGCTTRCQSATHREKGSTEENVNESNVASSPLKLPENASSIGSKNNSGAALKGFRTYRTAENRFRFTARYCVRSAPSNTNETQGHCGKLPPGLIIDPETARIYGMPELPARYTIHINAVQEATGGVFLVNSAAFLLDVLECGNGGALDDGNGGAATCLNGGMCKSGNTNTSDTLHVAGHQFDGDFTCSCPALFTGERCEAKHAVSRVNDSNISVQVVSIGVAAFVIIVLLVVGMVLRYNARMKRQAPIDFVRHWTNFKAKDPHLKIDTDRKTPKEIPRRMITIQEHLGHGAFGEVSKGNLSEQTSRGSIRITVAIKRAKLDVHSENFEQQAAFVDLIQEAALMAQFEHPNVLALIGVCTKGISDGQPLLLVIQYCEKGNLIDFMNSYASTSMNIKERLRICKEVAQGMTYLSSKNYVHRDLAARNVLVDSEFVCKICDFGLSRDLGDGDQKATYYRTSGGGALPVRWTALEALEDSKFTTASDVWSFGILAVEVCRLSL